MLRSKLLAVLVLLSFLFLGATIAFQTLELKEYHLFHAQLSK